MLVDTPPSEPAAWGDEVSPKAGEGQALTWGGPPMGLHGLGRLPSLGLVFLNCTADSSSFIKKKDLFT